MALAQKFDVVSESHRFLYEFLVLSRDMAHNACQQTYVLERNNCLLIHLRTVVHLLLRLAYLQGILVAACNFESCATQFHDPLYWSVGWSVC